MLREEMLGEETTVRNLEGEKRRKPAKLLDLQCRLRKVALGTSGNESKTSAKIVVTKSTFK